MLSRCHVRQTLARSGGDEGEAAPNALLALAAGSMTRCTPDPLESVGTNKTSPNPPI